MIRVKSLAAFIEFAMDHADGRRVFYGRYQDHDRRRAGAGHQLLAFWAAVSYGNSRSTLLWVPLADDSLLPDIDAIDAAGVAHWKFDSRQELIQWLAKVGAPPEKLKLLAKVKGRVIKTGRVEDRDDQGGFNTIRTSVQEVRHGTVKLDVTLTPPAGGAAVTVAIVATPVMRHDNKVQYSYAASASYATHVAQVLGNVLPAFAKVDLRTTEVLGEIG